MIMQAGTKRPPRRVFAYAFHSACRWQPASLPAVAQQALQALSCVGGDALSHAEVLGEHDVGDHHTIHTTHLQ